MTFYEYRVYDVAPGKMPAVHKRFADPGVRLLEKYGFTLVGVWQTSVGDLNQLHEIFEWPDLDARARAGAAFGLDEEWRRVSAEAEQDGPLLLRMRNQIWKKTEYSPTPRGER